MIFIGRVCDDPNRNYLRERLFSQLLLLQWEGIFKTVDDCGRRVSHGTYGEINVLKAQQRSLTGIDRCR